MKDQWFIRRFRRELNGCSWVHDRRYAEIVGRFSVQADANQLHQMERTLRRRFKRSIRGGPTDNPYMANYFRALYESVKAQREEMERHVPLVRQQRAAK